MPLLATAFARLRQCWLSQYGWPGFGLPAIAIRLRRFGRRLFSLSNTPASSAAASPSSPLPAGQASQARDYAASQFSPRHGQPPGQSLAGCRLRRQLYPSRLLSLVSCFVSCFLRQLSQISPLANSHAFTTI